MNKNKMSLQEQANELLKKAEEKGVSTNFFFVTTFRRYQVQMRVLAGLEKEIENSGTMVTKEYVKGRQNIYTNPAISEYNKTSTAANQTVATLINIVERMTDEKEFGESKLGKLMQEFGS